MNETVGCKGALAGRALLGAVGVDCAALPAGWPSFCAVPFEAGAPSEISASSVPKADAVDVWPDAGGCAPEGSVAAFAPKEGAAGASGTTGAGITA